MKGQAIADQLAETPLPDYESMQIFFPDEDLMNLTEEELKEYPEWQLYFDESANMTGQGIGAVLISPQGTHLPLSIKLRFSCTNNMAEYEAYILGLQAALDLGIQDIEVYGDSALIICQTLGDWKTKDPKLVRYHQYLTELIIRFRKITFEYLPRSRNQFSDALATLASLMNIPDDRNIHPMEITIRHSPAYTCLIEGVM